jgi:hypothetical protein
LTSYGFKLLKIELHEGQGHYAFDFGKTKYLSKAHEDVTAAIQRRKDALEAQALQEEEQPDQADSAVDEAGNALLVSSDDVVDDDSPGTLSKAAKKLSVVRFESVERLKSAILLNIRYGIVGDHDKAVDPEDKEPDADLQRLATTRPYRAVLIAPPKGTTGFLAVEVIGRSHAGAQLHRRLHQAAIGHKYKLRPLGPVADETAVKELLEHGLVEEVELVKTFIPSDSTTPRVAEGVVLTFKIGSKTSAERSMFGLVRKWNFFRGKEAAGPLREDDVEDDGEASTEPAEAGPNPSAEANALAAILWKDLSAVTFDNAKVKVKSPKQRKTLQPLDHREGFIYELGEDKVSDNEFLERVDDAARLLFADYEMDMEKDWYLPESSDGA